MTKQPQCCEIIGMPFEPEPSSLSGSLWLTLAHSGSLLLSLWLTLALSLALSLAHSGPLLRSLWLSLSDHGALAHSGSLWITLDLSLAHSDSLWLILAHSDSVWLTLALSGAHWLTTSLLDSLRRSCKTAVYHALLWWCAWTNNASAFTKWNTIKAYKILLHWRSLFWSILSLVYLCKALAKCNMTFSEAQFLVHRSLHQLETKFRQKGIDK